MAEYTIELKDVVENHNIFDFSYPFYDPLKRLEFEKRFIRHFYFREIGCPTIDRFKVYLEDKMNTVFPYYNKLMETATIDYDIMDNYRLTETYTRNVERKEHGSGISSTVGKVYDEQTSESNQNKTVDNVGNAVVDDTNKQTETGKTKTVSNETVDNDTTTNSTVTGSQNKTTNATATTENKKVSKFLDTPQGQLDLTESKYLTTLTQDNDNGTQTTNTTENGSSNQITEGSGTNDTVTNAETTTDNSRTADTTSKQTTDTTGKETTADKVEVKTNQEQRSTADNNTRTFSNGETKEEYNIERRGNIGVDTDSDGIMKHIKLQKVLQEIEKMFFDECEDLFMLVY